MYNEELARRILEALNKAFPEKLGFLALKTSLAEYSRLPDEDWLLAIDALNKDNLIDGSFSRVGFHQVLRKVGNMQITAHGRGQLAEIRLSIEDSLRGNGELDALTQLKNRGQFDKDIQQSLEAASD